MFSCCKSEDRRVSKEIDRLLAKDRSHQEKEIRLLLLGAGESGKSTFFRQIRILYSEKGFSEAERLSYRPIIINNLTHALRCLLKACSQLRIPLSSKQNKQYSKQLFTLPPLVSPDEMTEPTRKRVLLALRDDTGIRQAYQRRHCLTTPLPDSTGYLLTETPRILQQDFTPTQMDLLRMRLKTTGILEQTFNHRGCLFRLVDVGGQRNERRKWVHAFQDVTAVLFVCALIGYDQPLPEDPTISRMEESLVLFEGLVNGQWFKDTPFILFLNKLDMFTDMLRTRPLSVCPCLPPMPHPEMPTPSSRSIGDSTVDTHQVTNQHDVMSVVDHIGKAFTDRRRGKAMVYPYGVCATDTENVQRIFSAVSDILIRRSLSDLGWI
eukprot:gnl/Dysnectes_brevis/3163_a3946_1126.p1 GENE.gnl/Dysnectes_brevis/3163_a3946_1126~~gnl/Dysnectes_brevis/3163_a3946_1126.p1  ORF type:complete len:379 (-),score=35.62 gnl/Dysnectes_brevis/3163_a3946_1126:77-1213(-)